MVIYFANANPPHLLELEELILNDNDSFNLLNATGSPLMADCCIALHFTSSRIVKETDSIFKHTAYAMCGWL